MTVHAIASRQNPTFKQWMKLSENRRERQKQGATLLDGTHLVAAWLDAGRPIDALIVSEHGLNRPEVIALLQRCTQPVYCLTDSLFAALTELPSQTGLLAQVPIPSVPVVRQDGFCILLDGVQDPGNVGSILRSALAAGVDQILLSQGCADVWSPKVLRAGMGAQALLSIVEHANISAFISSFHGRIAALSLAAEHDFYDCDLQGDLALILGSEGQGVSPELLSQVTLHLRIPMAVGIESLNVAAATAVCLFERVRQTR